MLSNYISKILPIFFVLFALQVEAKESPKFTQQTCEALLHALDVDDFTYANISLPRSLSLDFTREQLERFFRLSLQVWQSGFDRKAMKELIDKMADGKPVSQTEIQELKNIRARLKHLRFGFALYDESHEYPKFVDAVATAMGDMQDGYKNDRKDLVSEQAGKIAKMLKKENWTQFDEEVAAFNPSSPKSFKKFLANETKFLGDKLKQKTISAKEFHKMRKVVSRLVSLLDTVQTLTPDPDTQRAIEYLSTINGKMGREHDGLKAEDLDETRDYDNDQFELPPKIRKLLETLVDRLK